jgi:hypothetical protein
LLLVPVALVLLIVGAVGVWRAIQPEPAQAEVAEAYPAVQVVNGELDHVDDWSVSVNPPPEWMLDPTVVIGQNLILIRAEGGPRASTFSLTVNPTSPSTTLESYAASTLALNQPGLDFVGPVKTTVGGLPALNYQATTDSGLQRFVFIADPDGERVYVIQAIASPDQPGAAADIQWMIDSFTRVPI